MNNEGSRRFPINSKIFHVNLMKKPRKPFEKPCENHVFPLKMYENIGSPAPSPAQNEHAP